MQTRRERRPRDRAAGKDAGAGFGSGDAGTCAAGAARGGVGSPGLGRPDRPASAPHRERAPRAASGGPGFVAALASRALRKLAGAFQPSPGARLSPAGVLGWLLSVPRVAASICLRLFLTKKLRRSVLLSPARRKVLHFFFLLTRCTLIRSRYSWRLIFSSPKMRL